MQVQSGQTPMSRFALAIALAAALFALFAFAVSAKAEVIDAVAAPSQAVEVEAPASTEAAPANSAEAPPETASAAVTESVGAVSAAAAEGRVPVASPPTQVSEPSPPQALPHPVRAARAPASTPSTPSSVAVPAEVKLPAKTEPSSSTVPALLRHASSQVEEIGESSARVVESAVSRPTPVDVHTPLETLQRALPQVPEIEGLTGVVISTASEATQSLPLLGRVTSETAEDLLPFVEKPTGTGWGASHAMPGFPGTPLTGLPPYGAPADGDSSFAGAEGLTALFAGESSGPWGWPPPGDLAKALAIPVFDGGGAGVHLAGTNLGRLPSGDALPGHLPIPIPGPPGAAIAPGSTSPSFVPLAALLALLALVAPVILRRFGKVSGFRLPTPFVCALERPG
jgi:outer membrane biosynthesis protein TonB